MQSQRGKQEGAVVGPRRMLPRLLEEVQAEGCVQKNWVGEVLESGGVSAENQMVGVHSLFVTASV